MPIYRMLSISTGHVKKETLHPSSTHHLVADSEYGSIYYVPDMGEIDDDCPSDLATVLKYAQEQDCLYVYLDRDGDVLSDLPHYAW